MAPDRKRVGRQLLTLLFCREMMMGHDVRVGNTSTTVWVARMVMEKERSKGVAGAGCWMAKLNLNSCAMHDSKSDPKCASGRSLRLLKGSRIANGSIRARGIWACWSSSDGSENLNLVSMELGEGHFAAQATFWRT